MTLILDQDDGSYKIVKFTVYELYPTIYYDKIGILGLGFVRYQLEYFTPKFGLYRRSK